VIPADEVGLAKTIEAGIVLCQFWAERRRRLLAICPASIRRQWALELEEKFNLPAVVVDAKAYREAFLWNMEKSEMQRRHVLFQEDRDSCVGTMLNS
jgi:SNF2 family DNA or RNA helicase